MDKTKRSKKRSNVEDFRSEENINNPIDLPSTSRNSDEVRNDPSEDSRVSSSNIPYKKSGRMDKTKRSKKQSRVEDLRSEENINNPVDLPSTSSNSDEVRNDTSEDGSVSSSNIPYKKPAKRNKRKRSRPQSTAVELQTEGNSNSPLAQPSTSEEQPSTSSVIAEGDRDEPEHVYRSVNSSTVPFFNSVLNRGPDEPLTYEDLDRLQPELESMLTDSMIVQRIVTELLASNRNLCHSALGEVGEDDS